MSPNVPFQAFNDIPLQFASLAALQATVCWNVKMHTKEFVSGDETFTNPEVPLLGDESSMYNVKSYTAQLLEQWSLSPRQLKCWGKQTRDSKRCVLDVSELFVMTKFKFEIIKWIGTKQRSIINIFPWASKKWITRKSGWTCRNIVWSKKNRKPALLEFMKHYKTNL